MTRFNCCKESTTLLLPKLLPSPCCTGCEESVNLGGVNAGRSGKSGTPSDRSLLCGVVVLDDRDCLPLHRDCTVSFEREQISSRKLLVEEIAKGFETFLVDDGRRELVVADIDLLQGAVWPFKSKACPDS
jgi:hypothetical protein